MEASQEAERGQLDYVCPKVYNRKVCLKQFLRSIIFTNKRNGKLVSQKTDPQPTELRGNVRSLLEGFLDTVRGESVGVSVMFDPQYCHQSV